MENYEHAIQEAMRLARTPLGQKLIQTLQAQGGKELENSLQSAVNGDPEQMKRVLSQLLQNPETRKLLEQFGR